MLNFLYVAVMLTINMSSVFVITKILIRRFAVQGYKEALFMLAGSAFMAAALSNFRFTVMAMIIIMPLVMGVSFAYLKYFYQYKTSKAIVLINVTAATSAVADFLWASVLDLTVPHLLPTSYLTHYRYILADLAFLVPWYILCVVMAIILNQSTKRFRTVLNTYPTTTNTLAKLTIFLMIISQISIAVLFFFGYNMTGFSFILAAVIGSVALVLAIALFGLELARVKGDIKRAEVEQQNLHFYISSLEDQYTSMRKFRHDYLNVLLAINGFIADKNWEELSDYYQSLVAETTHIVSADSDIMAALGKIKLREVKSIIAAKLILAQSLGIHIHLEATPLAGPLPINAIQLVRILGIILDNAIEALKDMSQGRLAIAIISDPTSTTFLVENTCKSDLPPLFELLKPGYSTKGTGRGLGLATLVELVSQNPNVTISTNVHENIFSQRLTIN